MNRVKWWETGSEKDERNENCWKGTKQKDWTETFKVSNVTWRSGIERKNKSPPNTQEMEGKNEMFSIKRHTPRKKADQIQKLYGDHKN